MAIDIVGFSTMSERDQRNAARKVENLRERIMSVAQTHGGRLFNTAGDGFMLEFASAGSALGAIQDILDKRGKKEPPIRVGAHVGDVVVTATDDLLGHGVNVAARLQELAEAGTALVSAEFRSMARSSPTAAFQSRGQKPLDNIEQRVQTFEILSKRQRFVRSARRMTAGVAAVAVLGVGLYFSPMLMRLLNGLPEEPAAVAETQTQMQTLVQEAERAPAYQQGQTLRDCDNCPEVVVLTGGLYQMGSPATEAGRGGDEGPQREVSIAPFAIGATEVTFQQWDACLAGGGCNGFSPPDRGWGRGNRPVIGVSWNDAQAYLDWLNGQVGGLRYRLVSESEWEYAARAGGADAYGTGPRITAQQAVFRAQQTQPVDAHEPNAFGLRGMHGNAAEWVEDCYAPNYNVAPVDGAAVQAENCARRVQRGGAFSDAAPRLRSAARSVARPDQRLPGVGFRVARTLD
ncbi:MAG TPA: SUMF1/EgtB/PvdO family nonheme iron enzyme [Terricaulis sp.]|nr:SUMF1/EgtB/PvdO family nonheme iron enzyme [Terricaulis sp.]